MNFALICVLFALEQSLAARRVIPAMGHFHGSGPQIDRQMGLESEPCVTLEQETLARILGSAFNPRYMSVATPPGDDDYDPSDRKRKADSYRPFSVDEDYAHEVKEDVPAWEVDHFAESSRRTRRSSEFGPRRRATPWECKSTVKWIDLGADYYPRYLRNVECERHDCWYGQYACKPKSFALKFLRRKRGKCAHFNKKEGVYGLPQELREMWVWEERAVNFCCECAAP